MSSRAQSALEHSNLCIFHNLATESRLRLGLKTRPFPQDQYEDLDTWSQTNNFSKWTPDLQIPVAQLADASLMVAKPPSGWLPVHRDQPRTQR